MIKIAEFKGEKGFYKELYCKEYYGLFNFKLKFKNEIDNCEFISNTVYCITDEMNIEVWSDKANLSNYKFVLKTFKTQDLI